MKLYPPVQIAPNLMAGVQVGGGAASVAWVTVRPFSTDDSGRIEWEWEIILPDGSTHGADDLRTGSIGADTLEAQVPGAIESLLSFLEACAESRRYGNEESENWDLFDEPVAVWALECSDEIGEIRCELEGEPDE